MLPLSAQQILQVWEVGQSQHPLDRALTLLAVALPEQSMETLIQLSVGQRDALLLTLRELTLGQKMDSFATCPQCGELLEFTLKVTDLRIVDPLLEDLKESEEYTILLGGYELKFRLPNSRDLAAVVGCVDIAAAQLRLMQKCVQHASLNGVAIAPSNLPAEVLSQISQQIVEHDPQAELLLDLDCPACRYQWQMVFDIVSFFWTELSVQAKLLLAEVCLLAQRYGWREADILAMSAMRRRFYLEQVGG